MKRHEPLQRWTLLSALLMAAALPAQAQSAADLTVKAGCAACHLPDKKLLGPSYHDIAVKNKGKADALVRLQASVRKGSKDGWGPVPMPASDARKVSDADLKTLITWILKTP